MNEPHALAGAYALDAVNETERAWFEEHLRGCSDCREDVASFAEAASRLPSTVACDAPPVLRRAVLGSVTMLRPLPPVPPATVRADLADGTPTHRAPRRTPPRWLLAAAAAVVIGAVGAGIGLVGSDDAPEPTASAPELVVERVLNASDARRTAVRVGEARATVVRSETWRRAALVTEDMPAAPEGSHYALWMLTPDGTMVAAGTMPPGSDQTVLLEGDASAATAVGVTVEPDEGVTASSQERRPSTEPVVLIELD